MKRIVIGVASLVAVCGVVFFGSSVLEAFSFFGSSSDAMSSVVAVPAVTTGQAAGDTQAAASIARSTMSAAADKGSKVVDNTQKLTNHEKSRLLAYLQDLEKAGKITGKYSWKAVKMLAKGIIETLGFSIKCLYRVCKYTIIFIVGGAVALTGHFAVVAML